MDREKLILQAQKVIHSRTDNAADLSSDFLNGFDEGIAEFLAILLGESATDLLEEISN
jgi:hypothetical protein